MKNTKNIKLALVDDHSLFRAALAAMINGFDDCIVISESANGRELIEQLKTGSLPDIVLLDFNMPEMNGLETALWLQQNHPGIRVLILTMYDSDVLTLKLLQAGVRGFLKKNISRWELKQAIQSVMESGIYHSPDVGGKLTKLFFNQNNNLPALKNTLLTEFEIRFLQLACTDLTYKGMAHEMGLNYRTLETIRDKLFTKAKVTSRIGLAMFAVRHGLVAI